MFENLIVRCSELGNIMTEPKSKSELLSQTTISWLKQKAIELETGRVKDIETDAMRRGTEGESESRGYLNEFLNTNYEKNETRYTNEYITGMPDIVGTDYVRDIKSSESIFTHPYYDNEIKNKDYIYQLQGYMWLTGTKVAYLDYILLDAPEWYIQKKLKIENFNAIDKGLFDEQLEEYMYEFELKTRFTHTYQDLPLERRIKTFKLKKDDDMIEQFKNKINLIRQFKF